MSRIRRASVTAAAAALFTVPLTCLCQDAGVLQSDKPAEQRAQEQTDRPAARQYPPDNTGRNVRDRGRMPTADSQGMSAADTELAARIRREVMRQENLSSNARNAKIVVNDGKVTLRGPVANNSERQQLVSIARSAAGQQNVTDQLELDTEG